MQWFVESETVDTGDSPEEFLVALFVSCECGYDSSLDRQPFADEDAAQAAGNAHALTH